MSYGLDLSEVRYETDHAGNRLKATIPYTMFSALTEFWIAARRAQTLKVEATSRPGQIKGSLQAAQIPTPDHPPEPPPPSRSAHPSDRHWSALLASLPADDPAEPPAAELSAAPSPPLSDAIDPAIELAAAPIELQTKRRHRRVFYREFVDAPPAEVMERIEGGVYFTRAWREYRGLTLADAAELLGKDKTTIIWHESGKTAPKASTLEQFAQVYDCPVAQMTPKPESDDANTKDEAVAGSKARRAMLEPRAPADTDYPDAVLAHLIAGKSPMLAWRLYRNMTLKALAEAYGNTTSNVKAMEANGWLRPTTIDKLCPVFHCKPAQLLRPEGMPTSRETMNELAGAIADAGEVPSQDAVPVRKARAAGEPVASAMEAAFMQAGTLEQRQRDKNRTRHDRLARMQAELARL